jgi:hypothetical protein
MSPFKTKYTLYQTLYQPTTGFQIRQLQYKNQIIYIQVPKYIIFNRYKFMKRNYNLCLFFLSSYELSNGTVKYMFTSVEKVLSVTEVKEHLDKPQINHFHHLQD